MAMRSNYPAPCQINGLVKGVIDENYKQIKKQKKGSITYEIKHPRELDELVDTMMQMGDAWTFVEPN